MRVRDEEKNIARCLDSVLAVNLRKEVVILLDRCRDGTEDIVRGFEKKHKEIRVEVRSTPYARAGLETLVTPKDSLLSLPYVMNNLFGMASYRWRFHVGADFELTPTLRSWLEDKHTLHPMLPAMAYRIAAFTPEDNIRNEEPYLSNCLLGFGKHIFWEVPILSGHHLIAPAPPEACIYHHSTLGEIKPYWNEEPWWKSGEPHCVPQVLIEDIAAHYEQALGIVGPEPRGCARGSNPECHPYLYRVMQARDDLEACGIHFFQ